MKKYVLKLIKFMVKACLVEEREVQQVVIVIRDSEVTVINQMPGQNNLQQNNILQDDINYGLAIANETTLALPDSDTSIIGSSSTSPTSQ